MHVITVSDNIARGFGDTSVRVIEEICAGIHNTDDLLGFNVDGRSFKSRNFCIRGLFEVSDVLA